jgi:hypothetical protein
MWFSRDDITALRNPSPRVIAMLEKLIKDGLTDVEPSIPLNVALRMKWNEIVDELVR